MTLPIAVDELAFVPAQAAGVVRAVILSDVHAVPTGAGFHVAADTAGDPTANALTAARQAFVDRGLQADLLICPGDLVHQGDVAPMQWVWTELEGMASDIGASLIGTVGNHDLEQKPQNRTPQEALRILAPEFPVLGSRPRWQEYWSEGFTCVDSGDGRWQVVTVDSCPHHGYDPLNDERGQLRPTTLQQLGTVLDAREPSKVNIFVCHHQPQEWTHPSDKTTSHILEGDRLIDFLDARAETWLLLHGHKHDPRLDYFGHGTMGSVRLAAGSVGASLTTDPGTTLRNQLHIVDFELDAVSHGMGMAGQVYSLDWETGHGWVAAGPRSGLFARSGFGFRREGIEMAWWLSTHVCAQLGRNRVSWADVVTFEPRAVHLSPRDLTGLIAATERALVPGGPRGTVTIDRITGEIKELNFP